MLIQGATVVTLDDANTVLPAADITIAGPAIQAVGSTASKRSPAESSIDASGMVVIPGLVNAHTHLFQALIRGAFDGLAFRDWLAAIYGCHSILDANTCETAGTLGALESVKSGVTTLLDHQFLHRGAEWSLATLAGVRKVRLRSVIARTIMDMPGLAPSSALESATDGLRAVDELLVEARGEIQEGTAMVMTGANTPGVSATAELSVSVREFAQERGLLCTSHVAESAVVAEAVRASTGLGVVEWLHKTGALGEGLVAAHAVHLNSRDIGLLAGSKASVVHNPVSNMFLGDGIALVPELRTAGVTVALGTDGASSNHSLDMFETIKAAALLQRLRTGSGSALSAESALRMATVEAARALGLADQLGTVEPGKKADLVILDLDGAANTVAGGDLFSRIVFSARPSNVHTVIVDGKLLVSDHRVVCVDEGAVLDEARRCSGRLAAELG